MINNRIEFTQEEQKLFEDVLIARKAYKENDFPNLNLREYVMDSYWDFMQVFMKSFDGLDV